MKVDDMILIKMFHSYCIMNILKKMFLNSDLMKIWRSFIQPEIVMELKCYNSYTVGILKLFCIILNELWSSFLFKCYSNVFSKVSAGLFNRNEVVFKHKTIHFLKCIHINNAFYIKYSIYKYLLNCFFMTLRE